MNFPKGYSYVKKGQLGGNIFQYWNIDVVLNSSQLHKKYLSSIKHIEPTTEELIYDEGAVADIDNLIIDEFKIFIKNDSTNAKYKLLKYPEDLSRLENIKTVRLTFNEKEKSYEEGSFVLAASLSVELGNCNKTKVVNVLYYPKTNEYLFDKPQSFLDSLCKKQFEQVNGYLVGTCSDCVLYPADKTHALRADYEPEVVSVDFAPGFQKISKVAYDDFYALYNAAKNDGIYLFVTSGYRSYYDQLATFNYWVSVELFKGYSQAQAEATANTYSARAGFSEHQLGTALDLNGAGCNAFAACTGNQQAWGWLAANAHNYGFALSYPSGKESQTGYIYEPWHYRWIGKTNATEYKKVEANTYLLQWLFELGEY